MTTKPLSLAAALKAVQTKHKKLGAALDRIDKAVVAASQARQELTYELDALAEAQNRPPSQLSAVSSQLSAVNSQPSAKPTRNGSKKAQQARTEEE
jgi:hypothetical protein